MVELTAYLWVGVVSLGVDSEITALRMEFWGVVSLLFPWGEEGKEGRGRKAGGR